MIEWIVIANVALNSLDSINALISYCTFLMNSLGKSNIYKH